MLALLLNQPFGEPAPPPVQVAISVGLLAESSPVLAAVGSAASVGIGPDLADVGNSPQVPLWPPPDLH